MAYIFPFPLPYLLTHEACVPLLTRPVYHHFVPLFGLCPYFHGMSHGTGKNSIRAITPFSRPSPFFISELTAEGMMYVFHQSGTSHSLALPMSKGEPHVVQGRPLQKDYCPGSPGHPQEGTGIVEHTPESIRSPFLCDPLVIWPLKSPLFNHLFLHPCILRVWWVWLPESIKTSAASSALRM